MNKSKNSVLYQTGGSLPKDSHEKSQNNMTNLEVLEIVENRFNGDWDSYDTWLTSNKSSFKNSYLSDTSVSSNND